MSKLALCAPVSGVLVPLDEVPDPVFAQRMVGDGVAIDPTSSTLVAPCAGRVAHLHGARHAITITTADGIEVMIHVGLDTVKLQGEGFTARVAEGDEVRTGQTLLDFGAALIARGAQSLLTQMVITNGERVSAMWPRTGTVVAGRDTVLEIEVRAAPDGASAVHGATALVSAPVRIVNPLGLHARPAAVLARTARTFDAEVAILGTGDRSANARSVVSLMAMEVAHGDEVRLRAAGPDADLALAALIPVIASGLGEDITAGDATSAPMAAEPRGTYARAGDPDTLQGVAAAPGVAVGRVVQVRRAPVGIVEHGAGAQAERRALDTALHGVRGRLRELSHALETAADTSRTAPFVAHEALLDDPEIIDAVVEAIAAGKSAAWAWSHVVDAQASRLAGLANPLLAARAIDLRDLGRRVLRLLTGATGAQIDAPANAILVAEELTPSDTATLDRSRVLGFCTTSGGATSHVAILARALDLPAVVSVDPRALDLPDGTLVVIDGGAGLVRLNPSDEELAHVREQQEQRAVRRLDDLANAAAPAITTDGHRVEVVANVGGAAEADRVVALGGDGVGLLRTEFLFLGRVTAPSEDEHAEAYTAIARMLGPARRLVVRTLDAGGDKPLPYLPLGREANPFLGERGIRVQLDRPDLLRTQLRAILRASRAGNVHVMFPMVATMSEWRAARGLLDAECEALGVPRIPAGIMIEVPAAAIMADAFAREVDFFSIGTNDLTQYTLAMDRGHPRLAPQIDGLNPAVLQLIARTVASAHAHGKWVGVCGDLAGDAQAIPVLVGLGVDELSVSVPSLPGVKAQVRRLDGAACRDLASRALEADTAADVRALVGDPPHVDTSR